MKKANKLNFKIALLLVIALLFSLCATALLVACDDKDGDDNPSESPFQNIIESAIGYCDTNGLYLYLIYHNFPNGEESGLSGLTADVVLYLKSNEQSNNGSITIEFLLFTNEEKALAQKEEYLTYEHEYYLEIEKNLLIITDSTQFSADQSISDYYKKIKESSIPSTVKNSNEYKFIKDAFIKCNESENSFSAGIGFDDEHNFYVYYEQYGGSESSPEHYACISKNALMIFDHHINTTWEETLVEYDVTGKIGTEYAEGSYCKVENDVLYSYIKYLTD